MINLNKTLISKENNQIKWYIADARKQNLGRLSSKIAYILRGKNTKSYLPSQKNNIKIIIINSQYVDVTGKKSEQKLYIKHSGKPGGLKIEMFNKLKQRIPNKIIEQSVRGMLPKNNLGKELFRNLKVYSGNIHPHKAQKPIILNIN